MDEVMLVQTYSHSYGSSIHITNKHQKQPRITAKLFSYVWTEITSLTDTHLYQPSQTSL